MDRIIRQITGDLISLLPEDDQYYGLDKLHDLGFPRFIVNRIQVELEKNLAESMRLPQTDWANIGSSRVQGVWQEFINAIRAEARLPASYAQTVIETAVADVLEMLIQPRKNIPEVIFGAEDELSAKQVEQRMGAIVIYRHFATLIPRYIEKKGLDKLTKERCQKVITAVDEKMTARYSPLNWAQMLEPLFSLMNEQIDTNLLRLFFEDKKMPRIARQFDLMDTAVNRAGLIEVLSSPDSLNFEGYEEDQSELFNVGPVQKKVPEQPSEKEPVKEESPNIKEESEPEAHQNEPEADDQEDEQDPIVSNFHSSRKEKSGQKPGADVESQASESQEEVSEELEEPEPEEASLKNVFGIQSKGEEADDEEDEVGSGLNRMFSGENGKDAAPREAEEPAGDELETLENEESPTPEASETDESGEKEVVEESTAPEASETKKMEDTEIDISKMKDDASETPMWQRYMSPEDIEAMEAEQAEEEQDAVFDKDQESGEDDKKEEIEEGFIDDPVIDLTENAEATSDEVEKLERYLNDDRDFFVADIFRDSERAYEEALEEIAAMEDWKSASRFIDKNVFKRNMVDMYSEAAVDFTDRLQSYFIEKSKS